MIATSCLLISAIVSSGAVAELSTTEKVAPSCADRPNALGVSRVVEIDTTVPTRFGNMQYKDIDFLKPGEVVLTFDDGPLRRYTLEVLNALEAHCTKATFFMVGRMAVNDPAMVQEIDRRGHTVGTHTWSHRNLGSLNQAAAEKEIELGVSAVSTALGKPVAPFFRFPYLSDPRRMIDYLHTRHQNVFSIDVDSLDYRSKSGDAVIKRIMAGLERRGKGILLFHDIQRSTGGGIADLLTLLKQRGYKVVHIVPRNPIETLAKYDEAAAKELAKYAKSAAGRPLAKRSIVWPMSTPEDIPPVEPLAAVGGSSSNTAPPASSAPAEPAATRPEPPAAARTIYETPPAPERQASQKPDDDDDATWRDRVFKQ